MLGLHPTIYSTQVSKHVIYENYVLTIIMLQLLHYDAGRDSACWTPGKLSDSNWFLTLQGKPNPHGTYATRGPYVTTFP